jgi:hypothetical protein
MRRRWPLLPLVALLSLPAACSDDGLKEGEARLEVNGRATIERADGDRESVDGGADVSSGDRVWIDEGSALMRLSGGTQLELREEVDDAAAPTTLVMGKRPVLEAGDLLVMTSKSIGIEADGTEVEVTDGAARLTRAFGMSVASYDADVKLDSAGVPAHVPALREMVVPDLGRPPQRPRPILYNEDVTSDPWDLRFLGAALALGDRLESFATGLTNALPDGEGRTPGFFRIVFPGLEDEAGFGADLIELDRAPGETLIGAAISDLSTRGDFVSRWSNVFSFRDEGAAWGIVALDQAVRSDPLVGSVEEALDSFGEAAAFVEPLAPDPVTTDPTTPPSGDDAGTDGTDGGGDGGGGGGGTPTTTAPPVTLPPVTTPTLPPLLPDPPEELEPVVDPVAGLLDDLLGGLLGGLLGPGG